MKIKVFADTICGWCFIGHSRLNKALEKFKDYDSSASPTRLRNLKKLKIYNKA